ncbi:hypothetical protein ACQB6R_01935 [Propionibacteriaceae bacterium G1746]
MTTVAAPYFDRQSVHTSGSGKTAAQQILFTATLVCIGIAVLALATVALLSESATMAIAAGLLTVAGAYFGLWKGLTVLDAR